MSLSFYSRIKSFHYAYRGGITLISTQPNAQIHALATLLAVIAGFWLSISSLEWLAVILSITLVWSAEALNTAIEFLADEVSLEKRDRIGKAKDIAAFGVLCTAIFALVVATVVFGPKIYLLASSARLY
jgi:diacylglycerol kinase (ATP)